MEPFMPASAWPGMEQMNVTPASGTPTVMVLVSPGLASTVVPSANVMSCGIAPVLASLTSYLPAFGTDRSPGLEAGAGGLPLGRRAPPAAGGGPLGGGGGSGGGAARVLGPRRGAAGGS